MLRIGINGFGRIGRTAFRAALARQDLEIVAVNDLLDVQHLAYLLRHDSVHGRLRHDVAVKDRFLLVDGRPIRTSAVKEPAASGWGDAGVDIVIESTGIFLTREKAAAHLQAGARRVIISAPAKDDTPVFVHGVNSDRWAGEPVVSAASCTTHCLAPICKVVDVVGASRFGQASSAAGSTSAWFADFVSALSPPEVTPTSVTPKRLQ